jgi:hypothetical protein
MEEPWIQAKPVHSFLGAQNIGHTMARAEDKASLKELLERKGSPLEVVTSSDVTTPLTSRRESEGNGTGFDC